MYRHPFSLRRCDSLSPIDSSVAFVELKADIHWNFPHQ